MKFSKILARWMSAALVVSATLVFPRSVIAFEDEAKSDAASAAHIWLAEIDGGSYAPSWDDASAAFKKALASDQWVSALDKVRTPLGTLITRTQVSALHQTIEPKPGATLTPGEYVVLQYETSFQNLKHAVETVTFMKEPDGKWRAAGYFVKPG